MEVVVSGVAFEWRGPAPFVFVASDPEATEAIKSVARQLTYGWGCIHVECQIGRTSFKTALMPKGGQYLVPLKVAVQRAESIGIGDEVTVLIRFDSAAL